MNRNENKSALKPDKNSNDPKAGEKDGKAGGEPQPGLGKKPSGLLYEIQDVVKDCVQKTGDELGRAYDMVRERIELLQAKWTNEESSLKKEKTNGYSHTPGRSIRRHRAPVMKFHADVVKAIEEGDFMNISTALEKRHGETLFETRFALTQAADGNKLDSVDYALEQLDKHGMHSVKIDKRRHDAATKRLKRDLQSALNSKNLNMLDCFVWEAFNDSVRNSIGTLLNDAIQLRNRLNRLRCIRSAVLHIDDGTLFAMLSQDEPTQALHDTMAATYLLLGKTTREMKTCCSCVSANDSDKIGSWHSIQKYLRNKDPKRNMKVLVSKFCGDISSSAQSKAQRLLDSHDQRTVYESNKTALIFYIWAQAMLREMETQNVTTLSRIFANM